MAKKIVLYLSIFVVWCLLNWVPDWQHLAIGSAVALIVVFMIGDMFVTRPSLIVNPIPYFYFVFVFFPLFLAKTILSGINVGFRILHPNLPMRPGIVKVKTTLKSHTGLTFLANAITLTTGTMSVDIDKDNGVLYVHWIDVKTQDVEAATKAIVEPFERVLKKIFD